jgi:uncharacterized protein YcnI
MSDIARRGQKSFPCIIAALSKTTLTTALTLSCMLALAPAASARVTAGPGSVQGGGTETFAVRLSNEQPDLATTRLELTFPTDLVIPLVEVAPMGKWDVEVNMRPVNPPVTVDGQEVDEAVASIVWTGGEVAPNQSEEFLVTAGPLPAEGGRVVLAAAQGYEDGTVDRWTAPTPSGWPGAPTIAITPHPDVASAGQPAASGSAPVEAGSDPVAAGADEQPIEGVNVLPWILLVAGVLVAGVGSFVGYRQEEERKRAATRRRLVRIAIRKLSIQKLSIQKQPIRKLPTQRVSIEMLPTGKSPTRAGRR